MKISLQAIAVLMLLAILAVPQMAFSAAAGLVDGDGNTYTLDTIGQQIWSVENWRSTKYSDGTSIPHVTDGTDWSNLSTPGYVFYKNTIDADSIAMFGALYNGYVVDPANSKSLAPTGWRVPTESDWQALSDHQSGSAIGLKNTTGWNTYPGISATNSSKWTGNPGGYRVPNGLFLHVGNYAFFWSSTDDGSGNFYSHNLSYDNNLFRREPSDKRYGCSVRMVKDYDGVAPTITSATPANDASSVLIDASIDVVFSEPINPASFTFTLLPSPGGVSATWTDASTLHIDHNNFARSTAMTLTLTNVLDTAGNALSGSNTITFNTVNPPVLATPANDASGLSLTPTLTWNTTTGATYYYLQVASDTSGFHGDEGNFEVDHSSIEALSYDVGSNGEHLANQTKYYWRVRDDEKSDWSETWSFTTIAGMPIVPELSDPSSGTTWVSPDSYLYWNYADGAATYSIQVSTSPTDFSAPVLEESEIQDNDLYIGDLAFDTKYFWRVKTTNPTGTSDWSEVWNFTTSKEAPEAPTLSSPVSASTGTSLTPTLTWNPAARAESYTVELGAYDADGNLVWLLTDTVPETSYAIPTGMLSHEITYYWDVRGSNGDGIEGGNTQDGSWSDSWSFTTGVLPTLTTATAQTMNEDGSLDLTTAMTDGADIDGTAFTLVVLAGTNYTVTNNTITPTANWSGTLTVPVKIASGGDTTASVNMTVVVEPAQIPTAILVAQPENSQDLTIRKTANGAVFFVRATRSAQVFLQIFNARGVRVASFQGQGDANEIIQFHWNTQGPGRYFATARVKYASGISKILQTQFGLNE